MDAVNTLPVQSNILVTEFCFHHDETVEAIDTKFPFRFTTAQFRYKLKNWVKPSV